MEVVRALCQVAALEAEHLGGCPEGLPTGSARATPNWILIQKLAFEATVRVGLEALSCGDNIVQTQALMDDEHVSSLSISTPSLA